MNNERFTFLKSARAMALTLFALCAMGVGQASAQVCSTNGNVTLMDDCTVAVMVADVSNGGTGFEDVKLEVPAPHAISPYVAPTFTVGGASVVVSTPGKYKYLVSEGCWGTFNVEDKTGPVCNAPADTLATVFISCTWDGEPTTKFKEIIPAHFTDCSKVDPSSMYTLESHHVVCPGDPLPMDLDLTDMPSGWQVCEYFSKQTYIEDWNGFGSNACTQYVVVLRPTITIPDDVTINLVHDEVDGCVEDPSGKKDPYFMDLGPEHCGSGEMVTLTAGEALCKYEVHIEEGKKIPTCEFKLDNNELTYKQTRIISVIDLCTGEKTYPVTQVVTVQDIEAPVIELGAATEWPSPFDCEFGLQIAAAKIWDCSAYEASGLATWSDPHALHNGGEGRMGFDPTEEVTIPGLAPGTKVTVAVTGWDACGNQVTKDSVYMVMGTDSNDPVCISNDELFVSLIQTDHGDEEHALGARVYPEDLDDSSYDNCGVAYMKVRMPDGEWADYAEVSITSTDELDSENHACSTERWVELQITDNAGNTSVCKTLVVFTDNTIPVITAPANDTITCLEHHEFGTPDIWGFCYEDSSSEDEDFTHCPDEDGIIGYYSKTWTLTKELKGGTVTRTATQKIYVEVVRDEKFTFPVDVKEICMDEAAVADLEEKTLSEILDNQGCSEWVMDVTERTFTGEDDACYKIVRTYEFINWCDWDENSPALPIERVTDATGKVSVEKMVTWGGEDDSKSDEYAIASGHFSYTQIIKVVDNVDPTGTITPVLGCDTDFDDCHQGTLSFTVTADDVCSSGTVTSWTIDALSDYGDDVSAKFGDAVDADGNTVISAVGLPAGDYTLHVRIDDACGNFIWLSSELVELEEFDCKKPTVIGLANYTSLMENCTVDIWLSDVLTSYDDNCIDAGQYGGLTFGMEVLTDANEDGDIDLADVEGPMPTDTSVTITSAGVNAIVLWAADASGNTQFTLVPVDAQDNDGTCGGGGVDEGGDTEAALVGNITNENDEMIDDVTISAQGSNFAGYSSLFNGFFSYSIPMNSDVTVTPSKDLGHRNGVNTADIVVLQRHILGINTLSSAYQLIAADINNSNSITAKDLLEMQRLIIGVYDEFPNTASWRFVDKSHNFANPTSPWGFPEAVDFASLSSDTQADFIGVKIGDLTGNAKASQILGSDDVTVGEMTIAIEDAQIVAGTTQEIEFTAADFNGFAGYQFSIELAEGVSFEGVQVGDLPNHSDANFALNRAAEGIISTNWANANALDLEDGTVLFTLTVAAANNINVSEAIAINSAVTAAEAYDNDLETYDVAVQFNRTDAGFALFQNAPNPFSNETLIGFNLPQAGAASLKVMDVAGRVIKSINGTYAAGYHQIALNKSELGATGVLYYQLDTDSNSATKKMVILE